MNMPRRISVDDYVKGCPPNLELTVRRYDQETLAGRLLSNDDPELAFGQPDSLDPFMTRLHPIRSGHRGHRASKGILW
jgi:hypothetical protein